MSNFVSYNTERMKGWSANMAENANSYNDNITKLYQEVEGFIGSGFTGGLAEEFLASFQDKKHFFLENKNVIEECANLISKRANKIDNDEQELISRIKNDNYLN